MTGFNNHGTPLKNIPIWFYKQPKGCLSPSAMTLYSNSSRLRAKVHGGCRLTFEEIARDMKWRKPSSEENKVRSSYQLFLFKLRWVRRIWNFLPNSFWKENCWYLSEASPAIVMISYICTDIIVSKADVWNKIMVRKRAAAFEVWSNKESWKFRTCTVKND